jgi:hypothetical protein
MKSTDLTLVCGSRPELLQQTLDSFHTYIFSQISIGQVFVNIDLYGGDEDKRKVCRSMILQQFPKAVIEQPSKNSFGNAVKSLWSRPTSQNFLHLEDDWVALKPINLSRIIRSNNSRIKQWNLVKPRVEQSLLTSLRFRPINGIPIFIPNVRRPAFTTSPSIIDSQFARGVSELMNPELNPEKQMFNGMNIPLENYLKSFRCIALHKWWERESISDIGRDWQSSKGIRVEIVNGVHTYKPLDSSG